MIAKMIFAMMIFPTTGLMVTAYDHLPTGTFSTVVSVIQSPTAKQLQSNFSYNLKNLLSINDNTPNIN